MKKYLHWLNLSFLLVNLIFFVSLLGVYQFRTDLSEERSRTSSSEGAAEREDAGDRLPEPEFDVSRDQLEVRFQHPIVPDEDVGRELDRELIGIQPEHSFRAIVKDRRTVEVHPDTPFDRATRYHVHFKEGLISGKTYSSDKTHSFEFTTESVRLVNVAAGGDDPYNDRQVLMTFDMAVPVSELEKHVSVESEESESIPVSISSVRTEEDEDHLYKLRPDGESFPRRVTVRLEEGVAPRHGEVPAKTAEKKTVSFFKPLAITRVSPEETSVRLYFNRAPHSVDKSYVEVNPSVPIQVESTHSYVQIYGDFEPGAFYRFTLKNGFPGTGRHRIDRDIVQGVHLEDRDPELDFAGDGTVLSGKVKPEFTLEGVNVSRFRIQVRSLYSNNAVPFALSYSSRFRSKLMSSPVRETVEVSAPRNERWNRTFSLNTLLDSVPSGTYRVTVRGLGDHRGERARRVIQVTDLNLTVRSAPGRLVAWVTRISDGTPVRGADVRAKSSDNQEIARGRTGEDGIAVMNYQPRGEDDRPFVVVAENGDDTVFVDEDRSGVSLSGSFLGGRSYLREGFDAYVTAERDIVRPGNRIRFQVVVRDEAFSAPANRSFTAKLSGPEGNVISEETVDVSGSGMTRYDFRPESTAPTGPWRFKLIDPGTGKTVGSTDFLVKAFVPRRIEASIEVPGALRFGERARANVSGNWLEGDPASGQEVRVKVRFDHATFEPDKFSGYSFHPRKRPSPPGAMEPVTTALDDEGRGTVRFTPPVPEERTQALQALIRAEVMDPSGRPVKVDTKKDVLHRDYMLGVRAGEREVSVAAVRPDGSLAEDVNDEVPVQLLHRKWDWIRKQDDEYYHYEYELVSTQVERRTVTLKNGRGRVRFEKQGNRSDGWYVAAVKSHERAAEDPFGRVPEKPETLSISAPDSPVEPGKSFTLGVEAPFSGTALLTLEDTTIHEPRIIKLKKGANEVSVSLPDSIDVPNVHPVITLKRGLRGRTIGGGDDGKSEGVGPIWMVGGTSVEVDHRDKKIDVGVDVPDRIRPGGRLDVSVHAPGATEAIVAVVDQGIRQITGHSDPAPFSYFTARRKLMTDGMDNGSSVIRRVKFRTDPEEGGSGRDERVQVHMKGSISDLIRPLALVRGPVPLNRDGRTDVSFDLPEYEGRVRVMVLASGTRAMGGTGTDVTVKAPLGLRVAVPRFLAPGDRSRLPVTFRNSTGEDGTVQYEIKTGGLIAHPDRAEGDSSISLGNGEQETIMVPVKATPGNGKGTITCVADLGTHHRERSKSVSVRPRSHHDVRRIGFGMAGDASNNTFEKKLSIPGGWLNGDVKARLEVGARPDLQLLPVVRSLINYPHGCLEQTTSRLFPVIAADHLLKKLDPESTVVNPDSMIRAGVRRLFSMQNSEGAFSMWPDGSDTYEFGTVYAADLLQRARSSGVEVPDGRMDRLMEELMEMLKDSDDPSFRIYAARVLSRAGYPVGSWFQVLENGASHPGDYARLAVAFQELGRKKKARKMLSALTDRDWDVSEEERQTGGFLRSPVRTQALRLRARMKVTPGSGKIPELAGYLLKRITEPEALTTQEKAHVLRSLNRYFRTHERGEESLNGTVEINDRTMDFQETFRKSMTLGEDDTIKIATNGPTYGTLRLSGFRTQVRRDEMEGLTVNREFIDLRTGEKAERFRKGRTYRVRLSGKLKRPVENLMLVDKLPGGLEAGNPPRTKFDANRPGTGAAHSEFRDDRVLLYETEPVKGEFEYTYTVRAVFPGTYSDGPVIVNSLYDPGTRAMIGGNRTISVK